MKRISKLFYILALLVGFAMPMVSLAGSVSAVDVFQVCNNGGSSTDVCKDARASSGNPITKALKTVISILALIIGIVSVVMLVIGGLKFVTSQGDPSSTKSARNTVIYALAGLVVAGLAQTIVVFVLSKL
jgi:hypothetical protein